TLGQVRRSTVAAPASTAASRRSSRAQQRSFMNGGAGGGRRFYGPFALGRPSTIGFRMPQEPLSPLALEEPVVTVALAPVELSVVVPVLDEADTVCELAERVAAVLDAAGRSFELVFVDDGSRDGTAERVRAARERDPRVKLVRLRRNFGKAAALSAGFDHCSGRLVLTMDGDLQDDPEEIPRLLAALEDGQLDLVSGWKRTRRDPVSKRFPSLLFNWVTRRLAQVPL